MIKRTNMISKVKNTPITNKHTLARSFFRSFVRSILEYTVNASVYPGDDSETKTSISIIPLLLVM